MITYKYKHFIIALSGFIIILLVAIFMSLAQGEKYLKNVLDSEITTISEKLNYELQRYKSLPFIISKNTYFQDFLSSYQTLDISKQEATHALLLEHAINTGVEVIYLLDLKGDTIATSNWQAPDSFLGFNYEFRPYFYEAINDKQVGYFGLGTNSKQRGFYFSAPIYKQQILVGVAVVKVSMRTLEEHQLLSNEAEFMFTNDMGVVFISSYSAWNDASIGPLDNEVKEALLQEKQFGSGPINPLNRQLEFTQVLQQDEVSLPHEGLFKSFKLEATIVNDENWRLLVVAPMSTKYRYLSLGAIIGTLIFMVGYFFVLYLLGIQRTKNVLIKNQLELEARVAKRTQQLQETNAVLEQALIQYKEAEASLKQTQSELIQAEKLAVLGEMSAGINHELNQPLAALRAYAETGIKLFDANKVEGAKENMKLIVSLSDDMSKIIKKFKVFSRKSEFHRTAVNCRQIIHDALEVLASQINAYQLDIQVISAQDNPLVEGDHTLLEQVFVNLIYNAIQAVNNTPNAQIGISIESQNQFVLVKVEDNGPGFSDAASLFTPFFTTKKKGLGLGLTLSKRIVELFGGTLEAHSRAPQGATFVVKLIAYSASEAKQ